MRWYRNNEIHRFDQGSVYTSYAYQDLIKEKQCGDRIIPFDYQVGGISIREIQFVEQLSSYLESNRIYEVLQRRSDSRKIRLPGTQGIWGASSLKWSVFLTLILSIVSKRFLISYFDFLINYIKPNTR